MLSQATGRSAHRGERGATAVLVALLGVVLFGLAALGVDLGHTFVTKRDTQSQADFSALAGAAALPGTKTVSDPAVLAAVEYLNANKPDSSLADVTAAELVDGPGTDPDATATQTAELNGEVYFPDGGDAIRVVAPIQHVTYGLAGIFGSSGANVNATATAGLFSPGTAVMPAYAVSGCDYGPQVLTDPATGHVTPAVPTLAASGDSNVSDLDTPTGASPNPNPSSIDVNPAVPVTVTITGQKLDEAKAIGFFKEGETSPPGPTLVVPQSEFTSQSAGAISFVLPSAAASDVTATEALYWLRVRSKRSNSDPTLQWSSISKPSGALNTTPFRVGMPYLQCVGASNDGNFGTLILAREDTSKSSATGWLPVNIAAGMQPPLTLHTFPAAVGPDGFCSPAPSTPNTSIQSGPLIYTQTAHTAMISELLPKTNCVDTDTGLPANSATAGLITWTGSVDGMDGSTVTKGRLLKPASPGCPSTRAVTIQSTNYDINDDTLTCFFTDDTATVADVSATTYTYNSGTPVVSSEIYASPRFYWVPVLKVKPATGGSQHYAIIDFRPAFITDQPTAATRPTPLVGPENGVEVDGNDVTQIRVVFLNRDAIQDATGGPVIPWLGVGQRIIRLTD